MQGLSNQDTYIFQDQDLIVTQQSQISSYILKDQDGNDITSAQVASSMGANGKSPGLIDGPCDGFTELSQLHRSYNVIGLIHSKKCLDCS